MHLDELRQELTTECLCKYFLTELFHFRTQQAGHFEGRTIAGSEEDSSRINKLRQSNSLCGSQQPWWEKIPFNNHEECRVRIIGLFLLCAVYLQCPLKLGSGS